METSGAYTMIQIKTENEIKEEFNSESDIDFHYEDIKSNIVKKEQEECGDVVSKTHFFVKFEKNCENTIRGEDMTEMKTENDCDDFDRRGIKYEPCQLGIISETYGGAYDLIDQRYAYSQSEVQEEKKYVAVDLNSMDVDFTYISTIPNTSQQIKSEVDGNIHNGDINTKFVEKKADKSEICSRKKPFHCKICFKTFSSSSTLKTHQKIHTGERPFHCKICSKAFTRSHHLKYHERIHTGEKPFNCKICSKSFTQPSILEVHQRIHTGERPYECKYCSKAFRQLANLKEHELTHTGEKPFQCKICSASFTNLSGLKWHEKIHTGEKKFCCKICPKAFTRSSHLKGHIRIHTGEKPFHCKICSVSFTNSSGLKWHDRVHRETKTFQCQICSKTFTLSSSLKRHEKIHTKR